MIRPSVVHPAHADETDVRAAEFDYAGLLEELPARVGKVVADAEVRDGSRTGRLTGSREQRVGDGVPAARGSAAGAAG